MQVQKILRTCQPHTIALGAATLVAYSRSMVKLKNACTYMKLMFFITEPHAKFNECE